MRRPPPLMGADRPSGRVRCLQWQALYCSCGHLADETEKEWHRSACLATSKASPRLNGSNWQRICGIASIRTVRRSHSRRPRWLSSTGGWKSCAILQTQVSPGKSFASASTLACGENDVSRSRSAGSRGGHSGGGSLVRESGSGAGRRVPAVGGSWRRSHPARSRDLTQDTWGCSPGHAAPFPVRAVFRAGSADGACRRLPARAARPGPLAAASSGQARGVALGLRDRRGRSAAAGASRGAA